MFYLSCWWCQLNYTTTKNVFCHVKSPFLFNYMYVCKVGVYAFFLFMFFFHTILACLRESRFLWSFSIQSCHPSKKPQLTIKFTAPHIYKSHYVKKYSFLSSLIQWTIIFRIEAHWIQMWLWTSARNKCFVVFQLRKQSQCHIWLCHRVSLTQYSDFLLQLVSVFQFSSS